METRSSEVMRQWFGRVWTGRDRAAIHELFPPDGLSHGLGPAPVRGPQEFEALWSGFQAAFPEGLRIEVLREVDQGPLTYVHCRATATVRGREISFDGGCLCRIEDGRIAESWNCWDFLGLLTLVGAVDADLLPRTLAALAAGG